MQASARCNKLGCWGEGREEGRLLNVKRLAMKEVGEKKEVRRATDADKKRGMSAGKHETLLALFVARPSHSYESEGTTAAVSLPSENSASSSEKLSCSPIK